MWHVSPTRIPVTNIKLIPIIVSDAPSIALDKYVMNVSISDLQKVYSWIKKNKDLLVSLSEGEIDDYDFVKSIKKHSSHKNQIF